MQIKVYLDTEFIENGETIDLISIALVKEAGQELYLGNQDCDFDQASDWVKENVLCPMGFEVGSEGKMIIPDIPNFWFSKKAIAEEIFKFLGGEFNDDGSTKTLSAKPSFWGWYSSTDWVAFYQLYGRLIDLPLGFPLHCCDLKQECDRLGNPKLPSKTKQAHNALEDAKWIRQVSWFLQEYEENKLSKVDQLESREFWNSIIFDDKGALDLPQIRKELADYYSVISEVPKVYCRLTNNRLSKPKYDADFIVSTVEEIQEEETEQYLRESIALIAEKLFENSEDMEQKMLKAVNLD